MQLGVEIFIPSAGAFGMIVWHPKAQLNRPNDYVYTYLCTVHYKEPSKSCEVRIEHSPGFGLPSIAMIVHRAT